MKMCTQYKAHSLHIVWSYSVNKHTSWSILMQPLKHTHQTHERQTLFGLNLEEPRPLVWIMENCVELNGTDSYWEVLKSARKRGSRLKGGQKPFQMYLTSTDWFEEMLSAEKYRKVLKSTRKCRKHRKVPKTSRAPEKYRELNWKAPSDAMRNAKST